MSERFFTSYACTSGTHCAVCRDRAGPHGIAFRVMIRGVYPKDPELKRGGDDFACVHGRPWGYQGKKPVPQTGPGAQLTHLLGRLGIKADDGGCECKAHAARMDREGPAWCEANLETIVGWLREEAGRRGIPFVELVARMMVKLAIRRARAAEKTKRRG